MSDRGGVRAQWHLADLAQADDDPFDAVMFTSGIELDLAATEQELAEQVCELLMREGRLAKRGLRCALKDGGQDCLTCSVATLDPEERLSQLCRLGKDQVTVERRFAEKAETRTGALDALVQVADEASELCLSDELAELLTEVGA